MLKKLMLIMLFGIISLPTISGCAVVALVVGGGAGAGAVAYVRGELKSTEEASIDQTWQAAQKAVEELEFSVTSQQKDAFSARLIARGANDKKIELNLRRVSEKLTEVKIRVGIFGDEALSRMILEKLKKNL